MDLDGADPAAGHYNDTNRAFLQSFIARGTLTLEEGKKLLAAIFTAQDGKSQHPHAELIILIHENRQRYPSS